MNASTTRRCDCLTRDGSRCRNEGVQYVTLAGSREALICKTHRQASRQGIEPRFRPGVLSALSDAEGKEPPAQFTAPVVKVRSCNWVQLDWCGAV